MINVFALIAGMAVLPSIVASARGIFPPLGTLMDQKANRVLPVNNPDIASLISLRYKNLISTETYLYKMEETGYDRGISEALFNSAKTYLTAGDYVSLFRRQELDEQSVYDRLQSIGFDSVTIGELLKATEYYPTPQDLILFAVRDVFSDAARSEFGLDEDYPQPFSEESQKIGLSDVNARRYWAAHWRLPSAEQGFEMYHRRIIDNSQLSALLKSLDYVPKWREYMKQISYNPLTRVDVRRMYGFGVLDEEGVYNSYLDAGYSPENARLMTNFTVKYESKEDNGLTLTAVNKAYKNYLITDSELQGYYQMLGFSDRVASLYYEMAVFDRTMDNLQDDIAELTQQFKMGLISIEQLRIRVTQMDVPQNFIDQIVAKAIKSESSKTKLPTKADLEHWLKIQVISEQEYASQMRQLGYTDQVIQLYLTEINFEQGDIKVKYLPIKTYHTWLVKGLISVDNFTEIAQKMNLAKSDIDVMIEEAKAKNV